MYTPVPEYVDKLTVHEAYYEFKKADEVWSTCLVKVFGKRAGDMRYQREGHEHPLCVEAYREFRRANDQWLRLVEAERVR